MQLSDENISKFQMLHKKHFGDEIGKDVAYEKGIRLVRLMEIVLKSDIKKRSAYDTLATIMKN